MPLDILASRRRRIYSKREQLGRVAWSVFSPLFRYSPRPCFAYRRALLRVFGAQVSTGANIYNTARIELPWNLEVGENAAIGERTIIYNLGAVSVGARATISQGAHICAGTHDADDPEMPLKRTKIIIGSDSWVCADAFVGPNVSIGDGAVVGARAVVVKDVEPGTIVGGNPARKLRKRRIA